MVALNTPGSLPIAEYDCLLYGLSISCVKAGVFLASNCYTGPVYGVTKCDLRPNSLLRHSRLEITDLHRFPVFI